MAAQTTMGTSDLQAQHTPPPQTVWRPKTISNLEDTGLTQGLVAELVLKTIYFRGQVTGYEVADYIRLPFQNVVRPVLENLKRERLCEVTGAGGLGAGAYQYVITSEGIRRAREYLERTTYTDVAPVPWKQYVEAMRIQGRERLTVNEEMMRRTLKHLILNESIFDMIGPAVNSGKSIFLYGPPGNGKTTIAESIGRLVLGNEMYIPYAVEADGQIIKVFDNINHTVIDESTQRVVTGSLGDKPDARWIRIKRPVIMVGGELTLDGLELVYDPVNKYYEAPFQMKANGGMFLIDDFGRQQIRPRDLLNRWVVPMEKNVDFLALHTGRKMEVPFEVLIVFSTNLPPRDLVDEAFLRRIRHKIGVTSPSFDEYRSIFERECKARNIPYQDKAVKYLLQEFYIKKNRTPRASHPRDLLDQLEDIAAYLNTEPRLSKTLLDRAVSSYFVDM
ncbi:MAG: ATP-binding protein [Anaerolineales bacterium]|nr:ATP-binding protein [Anaerolineales bacterium]MCB0004894.1 ATP-binding protein [Anaerolineales bacterium]MCB0010793.1 ATP-binding protein [Anaerolineales bacterium]MCB0016726.1 ATP-binding protein [Anaerolineales bacterium]MCB8961824.1 ATP-binding protein [Ardenticatenales bacterium]